VTNACENERNKARGRERKWSAPEREKEKKIFAAGKKKSNKRAQKYKGD